MVIGWKPLGDKGFGRFSRAHASANLMAQGPSQYWRTRIALLNAARFPVRAGWKTLSR